MIDEVKKRSSCVYCGVESEIDGMTISIVDSTESGELIFLHDDVQVLLPVCMYHMVLAGEGLVYYHKTKNCVVQSKLVTAFESKSDNELRLEIIKASRFRGNVNNDFLIKTIKIIQTAREYKKVK